MKGSESAYGGGGVAFLAVARLPIGLFRRRPRPNRQRRTHHRRRGSLAGCRRSGVFVVEKSEGVGAWWGRRGDEMEEGAVVALPWPSDAI
jgi:hypothetical protein